MARLAQYYKETVMGQLKEDLKQQNPHAIPRLQKIVVSMGLGSAIQDRKRLEEATMHLGQLTGQKPQICRARKSVAGFRLREGMEIGCRVTLRGKRMYEFLDRLISLALPRVRDFQGVNPKAFDGNGNYSMGLNEQMVFPEVDADNAKYTQGLNITFVTSTTKNEEAKLLLEKLGMPFKKPRVQQNK